MGNAVFSRIAKIRELENIASDRVTETMNLELEKKN
jgi:hypothetical protein